MLDLSIIIVTWNSNDYVKKCLDSICRYTENISYEIIVIDNASSEGTCEFLKTYSDIKFIQNEQNFGFARANNQGIRQACGRYVILLNPDTELKDNALKRLIEFMDAHPQVGIVGPKLLNSDGNTQFSVRRFPKLADQVLILLKLHNVFPHLPPLKRYFMGDFFGAVDLTGNQNTHRLASLKTPLERGLHTSPFGHSSQEEVPLPGGVTPQPRGRGGLEVDQLMGAAFMIRKEVIQKIGMLDEKFRHNFEEVDYCYRAHQASFQICYTKEATMVHHKGVSFKQVGLLEKQKNWNHDVLRLFRKHRPRWQWGILWVMQWIGLAITGGVVMGGRVFKIERLKKSEL